MQCIFIHGPIASGKLTVAKELQKLNQLPIHHNHFAVDAALSLFSFGTASFIRLRESIWRVAFDEAVRAEQSFIFTFAPEASVRRDFIDELVQLVSASGGQILFIELTCEETEIERRIDSVDRSKHGKLTSFSLYQELQLQGAFKFPRLPMPTLVVPTNLKTPAEAAAAIQGKIGNILKVHSER